MTQLLAQLQNLVDANAVAFWPATLVFLRVGAMLAMMPAFGETSVPQRIRLVLALAFTAAVAPAVWENLGARPGLPAALTETAIGLMMGAGLRFFIFCLQTAGTMIAQTMSLAQVFAGIAEPQPTIGHLLVMGGLAIAVVSGLPVRIVEMLILSYDVLPVGQLPSASDAVSWGIAGISRSFRLALQISAPFLVASLLYNLALAFINKAMPALMVSFIGAPALSAGGLVLLALLAPLGLTIWHEAFTAFLAAPFGPMP